MNIDQLKVVAVIGAGLMGRQIALNAAKSGFTARVFDMEPKALEAAREWVETYLKERLEKKRWTAEEVESARAGLHFDGDLATAVKNADLVIEAAVENLEIKRKIFADLDRLSPKRAILATNSSSIVSSAVADATGRPAQVANLHYFNPAMVMEVVEVVQGPHTSAETAATLVEFVKKIGKKPVVMKKEIDGFIANRLLWALRREACFLLDNGYATFEDIDLAAEKALGHPMGPFRLVDLTGIDLWYRVSTARAEAAGRPELGPSQSITERYEAGAFGRKTGKGFYEYSTDDK